MMVGVFIEVDNYDSSLQKMIFATHEGYIVNHFILLVRWTCISTLYACYLVFIAAKCEKLKCLILNFNFL